jgi:CRP-like cAMP-binding protein
MIAIMFNKPSELLSELADKELSLEDGERLFRAGAPVRNVYLVREGRVRLLRHQSDGAALVLQCAGAGDLLAEASIFAACYHCDAFADGPSTVLRVPRGRVEKLHVENPGWLAVLAKHLALEVQRARARAEILSLKRVESRLDAWLELNGGRLPERGGWVGLSFEIGVSPEALYRELAHRRHRDPPHKVSSSRRR